MYIGPAVTLDLYASLANFIKKIEVYMKASLQFIEGCRCAICGCVLDHPSRQTETSMTLDHVYPKNGEDSKNYGIRYQIACGYCNKLKANHIPTALLYRIIITFKELGNRYPELAPKRIENYVVGTLKRMYRIHLSCKGYVDIFMEDLSCECFATSNSVLKVLKKYKAPLQTALKKICLHSDCLLVRPKVVSCTSGGYNYYG